MAMVGAAVVAANGCGKWYASCGACSNGAFLQMVMAGAAVAAVIAVTILPV